MKLKFYGGVGTATGANMVLECSGKKIMVDCGLLQGLRKDEDKNFEDFAYDPKTIDFLLVTHAHMDHIGKIPKLVRDGFRGKIFSTLETKELALPMLQDELKVMRMRHKDKVLFDENDLENTLSLWEGRRYAEKVELFEDCSFNMINAGHILGSAIIVLSPPSPLLPQEGGPNKKIRIAFTGDLGNSPSPLLPDTEIPKDIDYLVMESVYGDRNHESREERRGKLKQAILDGIKRGGTMVIPTFSIERTQVILYELNNMIEDGEIPQIPVFLDSPLALKVTNIYKKYADDFKDSVREEIKKGDEIFDFPGLQIVDRSIDSKNLEKTESGAKIILAGSGMSEGGRVVSHEAHYLPDPKATIILVGYQSIGSLGRKIEDGRPTLTLPEGEGKKEIKVRAKIEVIKGYSSHKDSEHLLEFVEKTAENNSPLTPLLLQERGTRQETRKLKKVFCIMGEPKSSLFLCQRIRDYLDIEAVYPEVGKEYELF